VSELEAFLDDVLPQMKVADTALHNGDASAREAMWSHNDPVTLFGAALSGSRWGEIRPVFEAVAARFSDCTSWEFELRAAGASGDVGYTIGIERTTCRMGGDAPSSYALRVTTVFRREDGDWKVVHRHADPYNEAGSDVAARLRGW
jgi:ketosteroid isomerase-like protein